MEKKLKIQGMHCVSCEILLERELRQLPGVQKCKASHHSHTIHLELDEKADIDKIRRKISELGYQLVDRENSQIRPGLEFDDYLSIFFIFIGVGALAMMFKDMELGSFFPELSQGVGVIMAFLLGIVASLSTCLVLIGGLVLGFGSLYPVTEYRRHPLFSRALPHIYFHVGRVGGFFILGGLLGMIGQKINFSLGLTGFLTILVALVMLYLGLQILGILPNISRFGFYLPKVFSTKIQELSTKNHALMPAIIGILTFFLPCGFTQSMQLAAVSSQSFIAGALIMAAFALGTTPVLFALGMGSSLAKKNKFDFFRILIGVVLIYFAFFSLKSGLILIGGNLSFSLPATNQQNLVGSQIENGVQVVKMDVEWSFNPNAFQIQKDIPVRWEINGINVSGCSNRIVIPKLGIEKEISPGLNLIEFTPTERGELPFSCWMGMLTGTFIVK